MSGTRITRRIASVAALAVLCAAAPTGAASAEPTNPGDTPARPVVSNMGMCSAFLGQLGVRSEVNHLLKEIGPFLPDGPYNSPGELYRIRAREHPDAPAAAECVQRQS